jgi:hypothetical protein
MSITQLVLSGGGPSGIAACGVLDCMLNSNYINIHEIETIHATSIGTVNSVFLCLHKLGIDYESIRNYIFKRPFNETYKINVQNILDLYEKKGIYNLDIVDIFFKPFFNLLKIPMNITMLDFYELTKIELYFYAININSFQLTELSHLNTPDLSIIHAIYMSSTVPILFSPHRYNDALYIDGGFMSNYPVHQSIERLSLSREPNNKIFGIYNEYSNTTNGYIQCEPNSNIIDLIIAISYNMILYLNEILSSRPVNMVDNVIDFPIKLNMSYNYIQSLFSYEETRIELYNNGYGQAKSFIDCHTKIS